MFFALAIAPGCRSPITSSPAPDDSSPVAPSMELSQDSFSRAARGKWLDHRRIIATVVPDSLVAQSTISEQKTFRSQNDAHMLALLHVAADHCAVAPLETWQNSDEEGFQFQWLPPYSTSDCTGVGVTLGPRPTDPPSIS